MEHVESSQGGRSYPEKTLGGTACASGIVFSRLAEAGGSAAFLQLRWFCSPVGPSFGILSVGRSVDEQLQLLDLGTGRCSQRIE